MDIKAQLEILKEQLKQQFETETPERKAARKQALEKIQAAMKEFDVLSQKTGTTSDQIAAISQLQQIIFNLGDLKS